MAKQKKIKEEVKAQPVEDKKPKKTAQPKKKEEVKAQPVEDKKPKKTVQSKKKEESKKKDEIKKKTVVAKAVQKKTVSEPKKKVTKKKKEAVQKQIKNNIKKSPKKVSYKKKKDAEDKEEQEEAEKSNKEEFDGVEGTTDPQQFLPGQKYPSSPKDDVIRKFYEDMYRQKINYDIALKHCIEHGYLSRKEAEKGLIRLSEINNKQ